MAMESIGRGDGLAPVRLVSLFCVLAVGSVTGRAIAEYDSASYEDLMENKDGILFKNIDVGFETAYKGEKEGETKVKRSEAELERSNNLDADTSQPNSLLGVPEDAVVLDENNMLDSSESLQESEAKDTQGEPERQRKCCNDLSYLKTFPPCCATTCCNCQETCPARGLPSPLPGTCSM